jgi:uncharacterized protein YggT (Ycf19 family)
MGGAIYIVYIVKHVVVIALSLVQTAMLVRAILSWFPINGNKFTELLFSITEPFIHPVRVLFSKLGWFQGLPIDVSFLASYILISVVITLLSQFL